MATVPKTMSIGPLSIYSTAGKQKFSVACEPKDAWTDAERKSIAWIAQFSGRSPVQLTTTGESVTVEIPRSKMITSLTLTTSLPSSDIKGVQSIAIVDIATRPYPPLTSPIADANIVETSVVRRGGNRRRFSAQVDGISFALGLNSPAVSSTGVGMSGPAEGPRFVSDAFADRYGHWVNLLDVTTAVEGGASFAATNTYDAGKLSYGLLQFASHTPNRNMVELLRLWMARADAPMYFPEFSLEDVNGTQRICDLAGNPLEDDASTAALCNVLNPNPNAIDKAECKFLARLIHLSRFDPTTCDDQVRLGVSYFKQHLATFSGKAIEGRPDYICAVVADVMNQGRHEPGEAPADSIRKCLLNGDQPIPDDQVFRQLLAIGRKTYGGRIKSLKTRIAELMKAGRLGARIYSNGVFVVPGS